MTDSQTEILAQGAFPRMQELRAILGRSGIQAELVAPPGSGGNS